MVPSIETIGTIGTIYNQEPLHTPEAIYLLYVPVI